MKKFYVWGTGPAQSALIREAEASHEAAEAAMENGFEFTSPDDWAVEVKTSEEEEEIDKATRFDPSVAGYAAAELTMVLNPVQQNKTRKRGNHDGRNLIYQNRL